MINKCPLCGGSVHKVSKKVPLDLPNPGLILVPGNFVECKSCGEGFFDEASADAFSKEIDNVLKTKPLKIDKGVMII